MNKSGINFSQLKVSAENFIDLLSLIKSGEISGKIAKEVLDIMFETGELASKIVESKGLKQDSDISSIEKIIDEVIKNNQENFVKCQNGDQKLFGFFVGQIMKASKGQANPQIVNEILKKKIG